MIGSSVETINEIIDFDQIHFEVSFDAFERTLDRYPQDRIPSTDPLTAVVLEEPSLSDVRTAFKPLTAYRVCANPQVESARRSLFGPLQRLLRATDDHVTVIQSDMRSLSKDLSRHYNKWNAVAWTCTVVALSLVAMLLWSLNSLVLKPFRTLLDGSRLVAGGQFDHRIDLGTDDELSELAMR